MTSAIPKIQPVLSSLCFLIVISISETHFITRSTTYTFSIPRSYSASGPVSLRLLPDSSKVYFFNITSNLKFPLQLESYGRGVLRGVEEVIWSGGVSTALALGDKV
jgi:hypothetical protein